MRRFVFLFLLLVLSVGCLNNQVSPDGLKKETETIHDEAMKSMAEMNRVGRQLKKELARPDSMGLRRDSVIQVLARMEKAETEMMAWMTEYAEPDGMSEVEAIAYLQAQKASIAKNYNDIKDALSEGSRLTKKQ
jgi:hypothetical protein